MKRLTALSSDLILLNLRGKMAFIRSIYRNHTHIHRIRGNRIHGRNRNIHHSKLRHHFQQTSFYVHSIRIHDRIHHNHSIHVRIHSLHSIHHSKLQLQTQDQIQQISCHSIYHDRIHHIHGIHRIHGIRGIHHIHHIRSRLRHQDQLQLLRQPQLQVRLQVQKQLLSFSCHSIHGIHHIHG